MALGCCEICDAQDVPGSRCGSDVCTDGFFCFLCQGDEFDPYGEIEVDCQTCDGAGCHDCGRSGKVTIETEPVTLDDHEEIMAAFDATIAMIKHWMEAV